MHEPSTKTRLKVIASAENWTLHEETTPETGQQEEARLWLETRIAGDELELPIMPEAPALLLQMTDDESCRVQDLVDVVQRDPSLAAHLLRISNSPFYAPRYPATTLRQAITRLGITELRRVAMTIACMTRVFRVREWEKEMADLFLHSLTTAIYSTEIATLLCTTEEEAFLCGLLHDVGHAVVLHGLADFEEQRGERLSRDRVTALAQDYHTEVGRRLAHRWGMAPRVAEVVGLHHDTIKVPSVGLAITCLSDVLAYGSSEALDAMREGPLLRELGLDADAVRQLFEKRRQIVALARALV